MSEIVQCQHKVIVNQGAYDSCSDYGGIRYFRGRWEWPDDVNRAYSAGFAAGVERAAEYLAGYCGYMVSLNTLHNVRALTPSAPPSDATGGERCPVCRQPESHHATVWAKGNPVRECPVDPSAEPPQPAKGCWRCDGRGWVPTKDEDIVVATCPTCSGSGTEPGRGA